MEHHSAAEVFPLMSEREFAEFKADVAAHGLREPIWTYMGQVLDGRNRDRACRELEIPLRTQEYDGDDPFAFVVSLNLHRRHLDESQRAMVAARLANRPQGRPSKKAPIGAFSQSEAAALLNVGEGSVDRAKQVIDSGDAGLIALVDAGELTVNAAVTELRRRENTAHREKIAALDPGSPDKLYHVVVIDPPWPMQKIEREVAPNQAGFSYPTMSIEEISTLEIPAADDCHLWLWTTHKFLPDALRVLEAWRFKYVCTFVWHKPGGFQPFNLPQYNCEFALYARRGAPTFADVKSFFTCFNAPRGAHSEKPEEFYELVRRTTDGARIDMFNRRAIEGFDTWGKESARLAS